MHYDSAHSPQLESSRKLSEIKSLHDKIRVSTEEAKKKEDVYKQLVWTGFMHLFGKQADSY